MSTIRTFIALDVLDVTRAKIAQLQDELRHEREHISWTKPYNIHLTLKFMGDVEGKLLPEIIKAVQSVCIKQKPFEFEIKDLGCFPNPKRARVLWVGVDNPDGQLACFAKNIEECLIQFGFSKENRKFNPHLTIGRVKSPLRSGFIDLIKDKPFYAGKIKAGEIAVIKSELKPTGAVYTPLARIKLENSSLEEGRE